MESNEESCMCGGGGDGDDASLWVHTFNGCAPVALPSPSMEHFRRGDEGRSIRDTVARLREALRFAKRRFQENWVKKDAPNTDMVDLRITLMLWSDRCKEVQAALDSVLTDIQVKRFAKSRAAQRNQEALAKFYTPTAA